MGTENSITGGTFWGPVVQGGTVALGPAPVRPSGLPPRTLFVGREQLLTELLDALDTGHGPLLVSALAGLGGIGKTALAVETAHRALPRFPGGVLFIDLHGYDEHPVTPEQALDTLLHALGGDLPPDPAAKQHLYRSRLAALDGPLLLIADNASSPAQVTPLLPGDPRHRVLVTSRHRLADRTLAPRHFRIDVLDPADSLALLTELTGVDDPLLPELAELCGHLPLALRIAGALLTDRSPAELAAALADTRARLAALDLGPDLAVRTAFDLSYRRLSRAEARLFALLSLHPGPDLSPGAAAALAGRPEADTLELLRALTRAHLLEEADGGRYRFHDLVRLYAANLRGRGVRAARKRLLAHYLDVLAGIRADREPHTWPRARPWLAAEESSLIALLPLAEQLGGRRAVTHLDSALDHLRVCRVARHLAAVVHGAALNVTTLVLLMEREQRIGTPASPELEDVARTFAPRAALLDEFTERLAPTGLPELRPGYRRDARLLVERARALFTVFLAVAAAPRSAPVTELPAVLAALHALEEPVSRLDEPEVTGPYLLSLATVHGARHDGAAEAAVLTRVVEELRDHAAPYDLRYARRRLAVITAKGATGGR
ncbi:hypothetical protein ABZ747_32095 [Kitasatospora cineracea]|uniref:ATP-binding protein n=1 Tax=Kitasatospora cineracea TaxID=88074 RepID=UPI0033FF1883